MTNTSWSSEQMHEESQIRSKKLTIFMFIALLINISISLVLLFVGLECKYLYNETQFNDKCGSNTSLPSLFWFFQYTYMVMEIFLFCVYFYIRLKINLNLRDNYPEIYEPIKCKIALTFFMFELFLAFRAAYYFS